MKKNVIFPILFGFFVMGFVDVVGIATNYIQQDFSLPHSVANLLPMAVFLWFAVCSVPTGLLMNRYGKKTIVCASLLLTLVAMLFPLFAYSYPVMLLSFVLYVRRSLHLLHNGRAQESGENGLSHPDKV